MKTLKQYLNGLLIIALFSLIQSLKAQGLTNDDYKKALWMTTRFYGAQRSGENNWTVYNHQPAGVPVNLKGKSFMQDGDAGYDLSGGWFDCGDHVKFGQTQFYAAYMLLKGYAEFKAGYDDLYSEDYNGYGAAGNFTYEGSAGKPNGVPDILDEVKHATDYFIKCARNSTTFYYEVGNGNYDHTEWITSVKMQTNSVNKGGDPRPIAKNPQDGAMPSFCGATLALMSRMYRPFDAAYADVCLQHAKFAYDYAAGNVGKAVGAASGSFYAGNDNSYNAWSICLAEMFWATGQSSYKSTAFNLNVSATNVGQVHPNEGYTFDYSNNGELALYVLAQLGHPKGASSFNTRMQNHWLSDARYNGEGAYTGGGGWGKLRYVGNAGFLVALYDKFNNNSKLNAKVYSTVDYILGKNNSKLSFIVGFVPSTGGSHPKHPHHRNVYLRDDNPGNSVVIEMAPKNVQLGALVGGSLTSGGYSDVRSEYVNTEVCIDYNAGITSALGAINAYKSPIDTNKFLTQCASPSDLGGDKSLCGVGSLTLNTGLSTKSGRTFQWFKNDVSQGAASANEVSKNISQAGTWKVVVDSAGQCQRSATVVVSGTLPTIDLGDDIELCSPAITVLDTKVSGSGISFTWKKDGNLTGANEKTLTVTEAGVYSVTASASGCSATTGSVTVTSSLPTVKTTVLCAAGQSNLEVTSEGGPFNWYVSSNSTTPLFSGNVFKPTISTSTTYYLENAGVFSGTVGSTNYPSSATNWGVNTGNQLKFSVASDFTINALKVPFGNVSSQSSATITIELLDGNGNSFPTKKLFTSTPRQTNSTMSGSLIRFEFADFKIEKAWGDNLRMRVSAHSNIGDIYWQSSGASYPYVSNPSGIVTITGTAGGNNGANEYMYFYAWEISSGASCDRKPVLAEIDANNPNCQASCSKPSAATLSPSATQTICSDKSVSFTANSVTGYLYQWYRNNTPIDSPVLNNKTLSVTQSGSYKVRIGDGSVEDNACYLESAAVTVNVNEVPTAKIATAMLEYCPTQSNGLTLTAVDQGTGATYTWSGTKTGAGISLQNATEGNYILKVVKNNCPSSETTVKVVASCATGLKNDVFNQQFSVYPNPATANFKLVLNNQVASKIRIMDLRGVLHSEINVESNDTVEFGDDLPQGVYLLQVIQAGQVYTTQITKMN